MENRVNAWECEGRENVLMSREWGRSVRGFEIKKFEISNYVEHDVEVKQMIFLCKPSPLGSSLEFTERGVVLFCIF